MIDDQHTFSQSYPTDPCPRYPRRAAAAQSKQRPEHDIFPNRVNSQMRKEVKTMAKKDKDKKDKKDKKKRDK